MSTAAKWGPSETAGTSGGTQTYYFDPGSNWTPAEQALIGGGLALWSAESNIQWVQTTDSTSPTVDFIRGNTGGEYEDAESPGTPVAIGGTTLTTQGPGVIINITTNAPDSGFGAITFANTDFPSTYPIDALVHEEGHLMGFYHGGPYNGDVNAATQQFSPYDSRLYSIMSYINPENDTAKYYHTYPVQDTVLNFDTPTTPMMLDILAAQELYGAPTAAITPLSGGQVFGYHTNLTGLIAPFFDFTINVNPIVTLFDIGTGNTLDLSGSSTAEKVNLNPGTFSSFDNLVNNIGIAFNTAIDTFVGGTGGTNVTVNSNADTIIGQGLNNIVNFSGSLASYVLTMTGMAQVLVTSVASGITDMLSGVQTLVFTDQSVQTDSIPCYCPGTLILTMRGEVPVEDLAIGDVVITASNGHEPIRWIGRRSYAGAFIAGRHLMLPVCFKKNSLANGIPHTDLWVSPGHGMFVDGQLVPAWRLINDVSVVQVEAVEAVTYIHVELAQHAILLANGAQAESFLDETGFRGQFHNAAEFGALYPDATPLVPMQARLEDGFALQRIQERLAARAGILPSIEPAGALRGYLDQAGPIRVCGWAQDVDSPEEPVALEVLVDGVPVRCVLANGWRADLRKAGMGSGCHAFELALPEGLSGPVSIRRASDGALLALTMAAVAQEQRLAA